MILHKTWKMINDSTKEKLEKFLNYLTFLTQDEANFIEEIIRWKDEDKMTFILAKRIFEEAED